ncbi:hypothetical protein AB0M43_06380 [Longispora sp. NPDC051575]|uniref:hypothetical protein n=1 Tax=Longispora sp. NPDC051575 TaxID=3154943 RepID=UPI0034337AB2
MGARSFMVSARIPMPRSGFDAWLRATPPGVDVIANPGAMWTGWANDGDQADWELTGAHPKARAHYRAEWARTPLDRLTARAAAGQTLARHHDGALEVYLYDYYGDVAETQADLLMLAGASRYVAGGVTAPVLYWGGMVYPGLPAPGDPPLAVLLVDAHGARFTASYPMAALVGELGPVEQAYFDATVDGDGEEPGWDPSEVLDPGLRTPRP